MGSALTGLPMFLGAQDSILALRVRLNSSQREGETAARGLRSAREQVTHQARQLKAQLSQARAAERNQLANLTVHSNTAAKKLQSIIAQVHIHTRTHTHLNTYIHIHTHTHT